MRSGHKLFLNRSFSFFVSYGDKALIRTANGRSCRRCDSSTIGAKDKYREVSYGKERGV